MGERVKHDKERDIEKGRERGGEGIVDIGAHLILGVFLIALLWPWTLESWEKLNLESAPGLSISPTS